MSNTPTPTVPPTDAELSSLHTSLLKSLQLTVTPPSPAPTGAPVPDTGVEVPSTIEDFSEGSGSLADKMRKIERETAATPPSAPPPEPAPAPAVPPPSDPITPPPAAVVPPPPAVAPETPKPLKIPELPKPLNLDELNTPPLSLDRLDLSGLDDEEQEEVRTAVFAENQYPAKYKGYGQQVLDFIKKHKQFVSQQEQENPDVQFDRTNQSYQRFLETNRPAVSNSERKRLERERLLEEAAALAEKKLSAKTRKLEEEVTQLKATPVVEKTINDYKSLVKEWMPKEDDPIVVEAVESMTAKAVDAGREFLMLSSNLKPYDTKNETHRWLADFIQEQGELYVKSGHESLKRGARTFVPRAQYNSLASEQRNKHFTFTDEDILQLIAVNAKAAAEYHSTNEKKRLERAGYTRTPAPQTPAAVPPPPAPTPVSPRATPTIAAPSSAPSSNAPSDPFLKFMSR